MDARAMLDELFGAPLDKFVETRDRLAADLLRAGSKDESRALKKVKRPSPSAWATNQVVRRARPEVDDFLGASDRLRRSQAAVVAGRGGETGYQAGVESLRQATAALGQAARTVLAEAGRGDDRHLVERVLANVRAAALADARREELLAAQLASDVDDGGALFGGLLGAATLPDEAVPEPPPSPRDVSRKERERQEKEARQRQEREERRLRLVEARREEMVAVAAATRAEEVAVEARAAADAADVAARGAERERADARAAARAAQQRREALEAKVAADGE
jgi:hypothetical protein